MTRQLQIEWEKFFSGVERKAPAELRTKLEALIRRYAGAEMRNNMERFRYQNLTARYNTFNEMWNKKLRALEEGRVMGVHVTRGMGEAFPQDVKAMLPPEPLAPPPSARATSAAPAASAANATGQKEDPIQNPPGDGTNINAPHRPFG